MIPFSELFLFYVAGTLVASVVVTLIALAIPSKD